MYPSYIARQYIPVSGCCACGKEGVQGEETGRNDRAAKGQTVGNVGGYGVEMNEQTTLNRRIAMWDPRIENIEQPPNWATMTFSEQVNYIISSFFERMIRDKEEIQRGGAAPISAVVNHVNHTVVRNSLIDLFPALPSKIQALLAAWQPLIQEGRLDPSDQEGKVRLGTTKWLGDKNKGVPLVIVDLQQASAFGPERYVKTTLHELVHVVFGHAALLEFVEPDSEEEKRLRAIFERQANHLADYWYELHPKRGGRGEPTAD